MKRALVTGGAGFIGSSLTDRLLAEGMAVDVVDNLSSGSLQNLSSAREQRNAKFSFRKLDITEIALEEYVAKRRPDVIFHFAAQIDVRKSQVDPVADATTNVLGTLRVLEAARKAGVSKVVYAASGGTLYGDAAEIPTPETSQRIPLSHYGVSKAVVLDYLRVYRELYDLEFTALALANVYGPRQDPHGEAGVISIFGSAMLEKRACKIFGSGRQTRDFVFVDDVVDAFFRAADQGGGMVLNVGTGEQVSVREVFDTLSSLVDYELLPEFLASRPGELARSSLEISQARLFLGWEPWTPLKEGLSQTLRWMRGNA